MRAVLSDFNGRVSEVDAYFNFLKQILTRNCAVLLPKKRKRRVALDVRKILKAGAFLMLYNLVESSIRQGIAEIYNSIHTKSLPFENLCDEIREVWIKQQFKDLSQSGTKHESYVGIARELIFKVLAEDAVVFDVEAIPISGNLDAKKVRELSEAYGFSSKTRKYTHGGIKLQIVKEQRNALAHGSVSFAECGRVHSIEDLIAIKNEVVSYTRNILRNIQRYIKAKAYSVA